MGFVSPEGDGVRILALDGGDMRCVSQLIMLEELMHRLEHDLKRPVRPCEYFHLISGVGAAGIVAILLGVLGMTVADARDAFANLCQDVFHAPEYTETMRSQELERAMKELLSRLQVPDESRLEGDLDRSAGCRVSICYASAINMSTCRMFRSYESSRSSYNPTIVEAARASWATPGIFSSIRLGANLMREEIVSAVNGFNNPTLEVIKEAKDIFGKERGVSCLLSLGAGQAEVRSTASKDYMTKTAQDTETIARESQRRFGSLGIYFRFAVDRGMGLDDAIGEEIFGAIAAHTSVYLEGDDNAKRLDRFVTISSSTNRTTLDTLSHVQHRRTRASHALPPLSAFLVGREEPMRAIVAALSGTENAGRRRAVVTGMSGCGKTQISLKYAYDHDDVYDHILFVDASSIESIQAGIMTRVRALDYRLIPRSPGEALHLLAHPEGRISKNWLIIMDNADNTRFDIRDFFPPTSDHGAILITSRNAALGNLSSLGHVALDVMSEAEAVEALLSAALGPLTPGVDKDTKADSATDSNAKSTTKTEKRPTTSRSERDRQLAREIVKALGFLPIAVIQAGCYIKMQKCLSDYHKRLMKSRSKLLRWPASVQSDQLKYSHSTYAAFDTTIRVLSARTLRILGILSFFHFTNFPRPLVAIAASGGFAYDPYDLLDRTPGYQDSIDLLNTVLCPDGDWDEFEFDLVLEELQQYSLVTLVPVHTIVTLRFHPLLHAWSRDRLSEQERSSLGAAAIRLLVCGTNPDEGYIWQYLTPHVNLLSLTSDDLHVNDRGALAMILRSSGGQSDKLVTIWQAIHAKVEKVYGKQHVRTIRAASMLADAYGDQGDHGRMENMERQLLEVCRLTLGDENLDTARLMGNLANTCVERAEGLPEAEKLSREALNIHKTLLGPHHRNIVADLRRLATVYMIRQEYLEGISVLTDALSMITILVGRAHSATIETLEQLARCHIGAGKTIEGVALRREAMDLWLEVHGDKHVMTLSAMANLAATYHFQAQYIEAENLWRDVAEGRREVFGDQNESFLAALKYLGRAIFFQGRYADAEEVYKDAWMGYQALHGEHDELTLDALYWYALSTFRQNRYAAAETLWSEELEGRRKIHGEHHEDTQSALCCMAQAVYLQDRLAESEALWRRHLTIQRTMDRIDQRTKSLRGLSASLFAQKKYYEAEELRREELEACRNLDGDTAPETMDALFTLATCVYEQGRYEEAGDLWRELLRCRREVYGDDDPDTLEARHWLGCALYEQERYDEAHALLSDEVDRRRMVNGDDDDDTLCAVEWLGKATDKRREKSEASVPDLVPETQNENPKLSDLHMHQPAETLLPSIVAV